MTVSDSAWGVREKIIDDFTVKVRNYVRDNTTANTEWVWDFTKPVYAGRTIAQIVSGATNNAGETTFAGTDPSGPTTGDLAAGAIDGAAINTLIRTWMQNYSFFHKVTFRNSGSTDFQDVDYVIRLSAAQGGVTTAVNNAVNTAISTAALTTGTVATAQAVNNLIDECQLIWKQQCRDTSRKTYVYNYCHTNHSSHANHGSRGRR